MRVLVISLALVLALAGWSTVWADEGFYVVAGQKANYAPVPKTGQTTAYVAFDDGALQKGVASPAPRFIDNGNGTVTDKLTGLIWLKNANTFNPAVWGVPSGAIYLASTVSSGNTPGLSDGSKPGDWRLPNIRELQSLVDYGKVGPALPAGHPFTGVILGVAYWSSTTYYPSTSGAWFVDFNNGLPNALNKSTLVGYVWPVRGGR